VNYQDAIRPSPAKGTVRTLRQQEELPLLRDHLLRLDAESRRDRFHGFLDDSFIERYAAKCADDGTVIIAYIENGVVRGAAELHPPDQSAGAVPEVAFSVEASVRRQGVGSILFRKLIAEARSRGFRALRVTTGAQNRAMRALAGKFGAHLTFRHGESTGTIDLTPQSQPELESGKVEAAMLETARLETARLETGRLETGRLETGRLAIATPFDAARAMAGFNRAYWKWLLRMYGWGRMA
jgi:GNAT superfamily N-acetyltransferase